MKIERFLIVLTLLNLALLLALLFQARPTLAQSVAPVLRGKGLEIVDNQGRVRREQTVMGLEVLDPDKDVRATVTIVDPVADAIYTLIPGSKTAMRVSMSTIRNAPAPPPSPTSQMMRENLGSRDIDGITAVGQRMTTTIPVGQVGNDRPIEIIDERWESPALKVLLRSLHRDPRTGDVEYVLTKISRAEPPASLFTVPAGYTIKSVDQIRSNPQPMTSSRRVK